MKTVESTSSGLKWKLKQNCYDDAEKLKCININEKRSFAVKLRFTILKIRNNISYSIALGDIKDTASTLLLDCARGCAAARTFAVRPFRTAGSAVSISAS